MEITRKKFLQGVGSVALLSMANPKLLFAAKEKIKVGFETALSGEWTIYGIPMHQTTQIAIEEINEAGGLLGREVELLTEDDKTDTKTGVDKARRLIERDKVAVLAGTISSAMREAVTPVALKHHMLYLYPTFYEGGACNKILFCFGEVPSQQVEPFLPWFMEKFGKKVYILGADYIWPHILNKHVRRIVEREGGKVVNEEYVPIPVSDFSSTIARIKMLKPDIVYSDLAGSAHLAFYKQFYAEGLQKDVKIGTPVVDEFAVKALGPEVAEGIYSCFGYFDVLDTPRNNEFKKRYYKKFGVGTPIGTIAQCMYIGIHLWAQGVRKADATEVDIVIKAMESGLKFDAPEGEVYLEPKTHHLTHAAHIGRVDSNGQFEILKSFSSIPSKEECSLL
jgi:branched-chain amino acid transport system substrate-binding protein